MTQKKKLKIKFSNPFERRELSYIVFSLREEESFLLFFTGGEGD
jgi:hypothetical protein